MKKLITMILCFSLVLLLFVPMVNVFAKANEQKNTEYFDDGSYIVTTIADKDQNEDEQTFIHRLLALLKKLISIFSNKKMISKTKFIRYYDAKDTLLWTVYLNADFTYNGKEAICSNAAVSYDIADPDWKIISYNCQKVNNTAIGHFIIRQFKLAVPLKTIEKELKLACDEKGNIT